MNLKNTGALPIITCSACGYANLPGEMFCQNCGVQLPPVPSMPPPPPAPVVNAPGQARPARVPESTGQPAGEPSQLPARLFLRNRGVDLLLPRDRPVLVIGRIDPVQNIYPDLDLTEWDGERSGVSRRHARILQRPDGVFIEDLNSTNFTFVNHIRLQPGQPSPLHDGDEIRLGILTLVYYS